jgi:hypothetical protein
MGGYLQNYGISDERRNRTIRWIIIGCLAALIIWWILYLVLHNRSEVNAVRHFLSQVNQHEYKAAYSDWGCTTSTPCPNYDFSRFMDDWGKNVASPWKIANVDGCKTFVTVNVNATGEPLESLAVQRGTRTIMYAPAPVCQEKQWHWKQFFHRIFHGGSEAPPPGATGTS